MQVIDKPRHHNLPNRLNSSVLTENSQSKLPSIYLGQQHLKYHRMNSNKNLTIRYSQLQDSRAAIRTALSKNMSFQHVEGCQHSFLPNKLLEDLPEPVKALPYTTSQYQILLSIVKGIFGEDFSLSTRDILVAKGKVSPIFYIFFTSAYYRPQSFCCQVMIYLKLQSKPQKSDDLYNPHLNTITPLSTYSTTFICANCKKTILKLQQEGKMKKNKSIDRLNNGSVESGRFEKERKKIMMSIMIASGRYKKSLINDLSVLRSPKQTNTISPVSTMPLRRVKQQKNKKNNFYI